MSLSKIVIVGLIGVTAGVVLWSQRHRIAAARTDLARLQSALREAQESTQQLEQSLAQTRAQLLERQRAPRPMAPLPSAGVVPSEAIPEVLSSPFPGRDFINEHWSEAVPFIEIDKRHLAGLFSMAFEPTVSEFTLKEQMAALLGLTPQERLAVEGAVTNFAAKYRELETTKLQETEVPPACAQEHPGAKKTFIVPPFPDDCQTFKRELNQALEEAVGPSRRDIFLQIARDEFARKFADFGRLQRTLCFAEPVTQNGRDWRQTIYFCLDDRPEREVSYSRDGKPARIPQEWAHLVHYVEPTK